VDCQIHQFESQKSSNDSTLPDYFASTDSTFPKHVVGHCFDTAYRILLGVSFKLNYVPILSFEIVFV
jgi:hypothetical protein